MLGKVAQLASPVARSQLRNIASIASQSFKSTSSTSYMPWTVPRVCFGQTSSLSSSTSRKLVQRFANPTSKRTIHSSSIVRSEGSAETSSQHSSPKFSLNRLKEHVYVLDTRLTIKIGLFLVPSLVMTGVWTFFRFSENEKALDFLEKHFTPTLKNLQEGRLYTLFTSAFGATGNITGGGLAESCTFLLFGGNLIRSFGLRTMTAFYMAGHALFTSSFLYYNYAQFRDITKYEENLANPGTHPDLTYTPRRDRRAMVLSIARQTNETNAISVKNSEEKQRNLIRMPEAEFLEVAKQHYLNRPAATMGGGILWAMLGLRFHPLSVIPVPYVPVPILFFVPVQLWACLSTIDAYPREELILSLTPLVFTTLVSSFLLPRAKLLKQLPLELMEQMSIPKWIPRHIPDTRAEDATRAASAAVELAKKIKLPQQQISSAQLEAMRKRNARFQNKK